MDQYVAELRQRMQAIEGRTSTLEGEVKVLVSKLDGFAPMEWVRQYIEPIKESIIRMELTQEAEAEQRKVLYTAHEKLIEARAQQERELKEAEIKALKESTFFNLLKTKWVPVLGLLTALGVILELFHRLVNFLAHTPVGK